MYPKNIREMKSRTVIILIIIIILFIAIQFVRPERNSETVINRNELFAQLTDVPTVVRTSMLSACYNCHSNRTNYPWYASVAPVSWMISNNIKSAKKKVNFSEWHVLSADKQHHNLMEIVEVLEEGSMPPTPYKLMHPPGNLNDVERGVIVEWVKSYSERIKGN